MSVELNTMTASHPVSSTAFRKRQRRHGHIHAEDAYTVATEKIGAGFVIRD